MNNIYIGFNYGLTPHDFSICLIYKGKVKCIEIERINRLKNTPIEIKKPLLINGFFDCNEINIDKYFEKSINYLLEDLIIGNDLTKVYIINSPIKINYFNSDIFNVEYINIYRHHYLHAISTYLPSGFINSAILCMDYEGYESKININVSQTIWQGNGNDISYIYGMKTDLYNLGIGATYSIFSEIIGLEEGSVMGLSAYGNADIYDSFDIYEYSNGNIKLNSIFYKGKKNYKRSNKGLFFIKENIKDIFNISSYNYSNKNKLDINLANLAAKLQKDTEKAIVKLANLAYKLTNSENICLAGGVALNVLSNTKILQNTPFKKIFVHPASKDSGLSLGASYYAYYFLGKEKKQLLLNSPGLGKFYSDEYILGVFKSFGKKITYKKKDNISIFSADKLSKNKILGWFTGGSEFGPRSLGYRSIIASPLTIGVRDNVNDIKKRQRWRPLAPVLLEEDILNYFEDNIISPYMTLVGKIKKNKILSVPGIIHIDGTARYQTVSFKQNNKIYNLIKAFKKITGESILINTSLNSGGEPIVETPEDAIQMFLSSDLDYLILENYVISKKYLFKEFTFDKNKYLNMQITNIYN